MALDRLKKLVCSESAQADKERWDIVKYGDYVRDKVNDIVYIIAEVRLFKAGLLNMDTGLLRSWELAGAELTRETTGITEFVLGDMATAGCFIASDWEVISRVD